MAVSAGWRVYSTAWNVSNRSDWTASALKGCARFVWLYATRNVVPTSELPCPAAPGATRPSLVENRVSRSCVGIYTRRGHRDSRLRRRLPFAGGSECPTPTDWTPGHTRRCALLVALEHRRRRDEHWTTSCHAGVVTVAENVQVTRAGAVPPSLLAASPLAEEGGLAPSITANTP